MACKVKLNGVDGTIPNTDIVTDHKNKIRWILKDDTTIVYNFQCLGSTAGDGNYYNSMTYYRGTSALTQLVYTDANLLDWTPKTIPKADMLKFLNGDRYVIIPNAFSISVSTPPRSDTSVGFLINFYGDTGRNFVGKLNCERNFSKLKYTWGDKQANNPSPTRYEFSVTSAKASDFQEPVPGYTTKV